MLSLYPILLACHMTVALSSELDQDLNIDCLCAESYHLPSLSSFANATVARPYTEEYGIPTITPGPSQGVGISVNSSNFTLSDFMVLLSLNRRIGPQPTNITGIEVQNNHGYAAASLRDPALLLILVLFQVVFRVWM